MASLFGHFPRAFDRYVEPFAGGASVYFSLDPSVRSWLNDINPEIFGLYQTLRREPQRLARELARMRAAYSEAYYYRLRSQKLRAPARLAARTVFLNKTGFNGLYRQNRKGEFNVPFGKRKNCPELFDRANLERIAKRLKRTRLTCLDFERVLDRCGAGDFVYCDPPYEPLSTTSSFNAYWGAGFCRGQQTRLYQACVRAVGRGATVIVSNSESPFIIDLYRDWPVHRVPARRAINSNASRRGPLNEVCVVMKPVSLLAT